MGKNKKEEEPTSGLGWAAYQEVSEDFDFEDWNMDKQHRVCRYSLSKIIWNLITYPFIALKSLLFGAKVRIEYEEYVEYVESPEEIQFHKLMSEIWDVNETDFEKFAVQVIDMGKADIELRNHRIIYQKVKLQGNWGIGESIEKLDGSDRFNCGWFAISGKRNQKIKSIKFHLAGTAASVEPEE